MANTLITLILVIQLCVLAGCVAAGTKLYSINNGGENDMLISADGICKSMVEPQGYICQEHTVINILLTSIMFYLICPFCSDSVRT